MNLTTTVTNPKMINTTDKLPNDNRNLTLQNGIALKSKFIVQD